MLLDPEATQYDGLAFGNEEIKKCSEIHKHGYSKSVFSLFNYEKKEKEKKKKQRR